MVLPIFFFIIFFTTPIIALTKIDPIISMHIRNFSLFNYDNLIADHYEGTNDYLYQLAYLIHQGTKHPIPSLLSMLRNDVIANESNPVKYMLLINKKTKLLTGYYFVDD